MWTRIIILILCVSSVLGETFNPRPIVGIMTQDFQDQYRDPAVIYPPDTVARTDSQYIAASYVKLVESAGARVVPIYYNMSKPELKDLFSRLNGVLLPGGSTPLEPGKKFYSAGQALWEYVEENPSYPVLGICLGMEWLSTLIAGTMDTDILSGSFAALGVPLNLKFTEAARTSKLFKHIFEKEYLVDAVENKLVTFNDHSHGVTPEVFYMFPSLYENFEVLGTSLDLDGKKFVAAYEGKGKYENVLCVQFHPEKNLFEWSPNHKFPSSNEGMEVSQAVINAFVELTRTNNNKIDPDPFQESKYLIESTKKVLFVGSSYFQEAYAYFPESTKVGQNIRGYRLDNN